MLGTVRAKRYKRMGQKCSERADYDDIVANSERKLNTYKLMLFGFTILMNNDNQ